MIRLYSSKTNDNQQIIGTTIATSATALIASPFKSGDAISVEEQNFEVTSQITPETNVIIQTPVKDLIKKRIREFAQAIVVIVFAIIAKYLQAIVDKLEIADNVRPLIPYKTYNNIVAKGGLKEKTTGKQSLGEKIAIEKPDEPGFESVVPTFPERHIDNKGSAPARKYNWTPDAPKDRKTIVYFHGRGDTLDSIDEALHQTALDQNARLIAMEYPHFGQAYGSFDAFDPRIVNTWLSYLIHYLTVTEGIDSSAIIAHGFSLGSGAACKFASLMQENNTPIGGLLVQAGYSSLNDISNDSIPFLGRLMAGNLWNNKEYLRSLSRNTKVVILHGMKDKTIKYQHAENLAQKCDAATNIQLVLLPSVGHMDIPVSEIYKCYKKLDKAIESKKKPIDH